MGRFRSRPGKAAELVGFSAAAAAYILSAQPEADIGTRSFAFGSKDVAEDWWPACRRPRVRMRGYHRSSNTRVRLRVDASGHMGLDARTVDLHKQYHEQTIDYTMKHMEWVQGKHYGTDSQLPVGSHEVVADAARERFSRWPELDERDTHDVTWEGPAQRFCPGVESAASTLGDPESNVFVISLPRRPTKLRHALAQLHAAGVSATIVDAVDGDAIRCQEDVFQQGVRPLPDYKGHTNHDMPLTTGEVGCFMSHFSIWTHMVKHQIPSALILEDDFDFQEDFAARLGRYLEEARYEDWNLMYIGRSPVESDLRQVAPNIVEPGYCLWTVGYIIRLDAAQALLDARVERNIAPLDDFFSIAMGRYTLAYNELALEWRKYIPNILKALAISPPLVMPYVGSMFLSDTAMLRNGTRYLKDLPES